MKKNILRALFYLLIFVIICLAGGTAYLYMLKPKYNGNLRLSGLKSSTEVIFDEYAVPHIYASNEHDAYFALGYVHAQERLFQMEMLNRLASGRLSEVIGKDSLVLSSDKFFRTLGLDRYAQMMTDSCFADTDAAFITAADAYLAGINSFIEEGATPLEFTLLGIPKEKFERKDLFLCAAYMSYSFSLALRTDPVTTLIKEQYGDAYYRELGGQPLPSETLIPVYDPAKDTTSLDSAGLQALRDFAAVGTGQLQHSIIRPFTGSNGWAVSGKKTESGAPYFCNDTHIFFGQPSVWYEAHLAYGNFEFYGNHLAGFPFGVLGRTKAKSWGLTMFENDDVDFYREKYHPENKNVLIAGKGFDTLRSITDTIQIKDAEPEILTLRHSRHGVLINDFLPNDTSAAPVSMWWTFLQRPSNLMSVIHEMTHAKSLDAFEKSLAGLSAPGLNVMYADTAGNIAWWAVAHLPDRKPETDPKVFLDGAGGKDEIQGFLPFEKNPKSVNPRSGFVYSANNRPDSVDGRFYAGYYVPDTRAERITDFLSEKKKFSISDMKTLITDTSSPDLKPVISEICRILEREERLGDEESKKLIQLLKSWDSEHSTEALAPVLYYRMIYHIFREAMADELTEATYQDFVMTHLFKRSIEPMMANDTSAWWDNIHTPEVRETKRGAVVKAFEKSIEELRETYGENPDTWTWGRAHTLEHIHPIGMKEPFDKIFNVGPFPMKGGMETVNNMSFHLTEEPVFKVIFGPAMRIVTDMADPVRCSESVIPTGQSGYAFGKYYDNQAELFNQGKFRPQYMSRDEAEKNAVGKLLIRPKKEN